MKSKYFLLCLLSLSSMASYAQSNQCGIYKTVDDFKNQQISIAGNCNYGNKAIQTSDFFLRPYIYLKTETGKVKYHQDTIYAVKDCSGNMNRIWHQKSFQLIEKGTLNILCFQIHGDSKKMDIERISS